MSQFQDVRRSRFDAQGSLLPPCFVERLHRTLLDEHFRVEGRRTWFESIDEMQVALDAYLKTYNND